MFFVCPFTFMPPVHSHNDHKPLKLTFPQPVSNLWTLLGSMSFSALNFLADFLSMAFTPVAIADFDVKSCCVNHLHFTHCIHIVDALNVLHQRTFHFSQLMHGMHPIHFTAHVNNLPTSHANIYRLFAVWEVRAEKYFPEVSEEARDWRSRDASETDGKYFSVRADLNGE